MEKKTIKITDDHTKKTSELIAECRKLFEVYCWNEEMIDQEIPQPKETTTRYFLDSQEPDSETLGKSYNDMVEEGKIEQVITAREYLLFAIEYFKENNKLPDKVGWTRTSSLWSDGFLVYAGWDDSRLGVRSGGRDFRGSYGGPRSAVSLEPVNLVPFEIETITINGVLYKKV